jgi:hypothetical protein
MTGGAGMTGEGAGMTGAGAGMAAWYASSWIPACAGMTVGPRGNDGGRGNDAPARHPRESGGPDAPVACPPPFGTTSCLGYMSPSVHAEPASVASAPTALIARRPASVSSHTPRGESAFSRPSLIIEFRAHWAALRHRGLSGLLASGS